MKKEKIKILILPSWYPPDGGGFFKDHAEALNYKGFKVDVLVNRVLGMTKNSLHQIIKSRRISENIEGPLRVIRSGYLKWPKMHKRNIHGWVDKYLYLYKYYQTKYGPPDVIIAHSSIWAGLVAARIKEEYNIPFLLVEHRSRFARDVKVVQQMIREWYFPFIRRTLIMADKIVTVSDSIDNQLIGISPGIRNKICTIPDLIDTDFFSLPEKQRDIEPFVIISFGILEHIKGFDILIEAFAKFVKKFEGEFYLRIGGRGNKFKKLYNLARRFGIENRVSIHGYIPREEVRREMQTANLFVLPSRFETFGVVLVEAMATGCPVISTIKGGQSQSVNENTGLLVGPDDADSLADAMEKIYLNYGDYKAEVIREQVVNQFTKEVIRERYHQLIREILNEKGIST